MTVRLPGGYHDGTGWHRDAELVALRGREEELLSSTAASPAELVTRVLVSCVRKLGDVAVDADVVRALTVGDRLHLLLKLREATFGPRVTAVTACPWPGCASTIDLDFLLSDVPVRYRSDDETVHEVELSPEALPDTDPVARRVRFRLPTGADQEELADVVGSDPAGALRALLQACVVALGPGAPPGPDRVAALSPRARAEIEAAMTEAAVGPALTMEAVCPECGRSFTLPFDVQDFFFGEVTMSEDLLYRQVHHLAYHYHWSEAEILELPRDKRLRYLEILSEQIERSADEVG